MAQTRQSAQKAVNGASIDQANGHAKDPAKGHANGHIADPHNAKTDRSRWRLRDVSGRHTWHYLKSDQEIQEWPQTTADKYHLGLPTV
jgi:lanosterol synthase